MLNNLREINLILNILQMKAHRHFTVNQRKKAKADFKKYKAKKHAQWLREKLITAIATTKFTPVYSLKVTLQAQ